MRFALSKEQQQSQKKRKCVFHHINAQRDVILSLNIDVALMTEELKCSTYA